MNIGHALTVAEWDVSRRLRRVGFWTSLLLTALIMVALVVWQARSNGTAETVVGVLPTVQLADDVVAAEGQLAGRRVVLEHYELAHAGEAALHEDHIDALLTPSGVVFTTQVDSELVGVLGRSIGRDEPATRPLDVSVLRPVRDQESVLFATMFGALIILVSYATVTWAANSVTEEKTSHAVEVILTKLHPSSVLVGKWLGVSALGLISVVGAVLPTVVAAAVLGVELPVGSPQFLTVFAVWTLLALLLYSAMGAAAGALAARTEDLQYVTIWPMLLGMLALYSAPVSIWMRDSLWSTVLGWLPFTAPVHAPIRLATGAATGFELAATMVLAGLTLALLFMGSSSVYRHSILHYGERRGFRAAMRAGSS